MERILKAATEKLHHMHWTFNSNAREFPWETRKQWADMFKVNENNISQESYFQKNFPSKMRKKWRYSHIQKSWGSLLSLNQSRNKCFKEVPQCEMKEQQAVVWGWMKNKDLNKGDYTGNYRGWHYNNNLWLYFSYFTSFKR
jgi:hypothetical protein